jgi:phage terminase Nu1 subunit (DNA packaging protein)
MAASEADLDALVVGTAQLAGMLDVSTNYIQDLTRRGVLEPLRKPNGAAVRGRYPLVATVQAFSRHIRTEKGKPGSGAVSEAALQAARLRKFQAEAILRTIAAQERAGNVVPLRGVRDMLSRMIHRYRSKLLTIPRRLSREFGGEVSELAEVLLEEALSELRRLDRDDFMPGRRSKERNGATEEETADLD